MKIVVELTVASRHPQSEMMRNIVISTGSSRKGAKGAKTRINKQLILVSLLLYAFA